MKQAHSYLATVSIVLALVAEYMRPPIWNRPLTLMMIAPVALVIGIASLLWFQRSRRPGRWVAWIAVVLSAHACFLTLIADSLEEAKQRPRESACLSNLKLLGMAAALYCDDYNDRFPPADKWSKSLLPYIKRDGDSAGEQAESVGYQSVPRTLVCPAAGVDDPTYAMNAGVAGLRKNSIAEPDQTPLFFDSVPGWNRAGGRELLPSPPRHPCGIDMVCFVDGGCSTANESRIGRLHWKPVMKAAGSQKGAKK